MNKTTIPQNNYFIIFTRYIKDKYKIILGSLIIIFILFLSYQYYLYLNTKKIYKNSLIYFNAKDLESNDHFYQLMEELSKNNDFYSVISALEIININLQNKNIVLAEELYLKLLNDKKLNNIYISAIASHASYNFLDIIFENLDINLKSKIDNFISYIDDNLDSYKGIKLELQYLLSIAQLDINNISPQNDSKTTEIYNLIIESKDISSSIKERVNKIYEFQIYK